MFGIEAWQVWIIVGPLLVLAGLLGAGFVLLALGISCLVCAGVVGLTDLDFGWSWGSPAPPQGGPPDLSFAWFGGCGSLITLRSLAARSLCSPGGFVQQRLW